MIKIGTKIFWKKNFLKIFLKIFSKNYFGNFLVNLNDSGKQISGEIFSFLAQLGPKKPKITLVLRSRPSPFDSQERFGKYEPKSWVKDCS